MSIFKNYLESFHSGNDGVIFTFIVGFLVITLLLCGMGTAALAVALISVVPWVVFFAE